MTTPPVQNRYYLTFGSQYRQNQHPIWPWVHPDGWVEVWSSSEAAARLLVVSHIRDHWSSLYVDSDFEMPLYPKGRLAVLRSEVLTEPARRLRYLDKIEHDALLSELSQQNVTPEQGHRLIDAWVLKPEDKPMGAVIREVLGATWHPVKVVRAMRDEINELRRALQAVEIEVSNERQNTRGMLADLREQLANAKRAPEMKEPPDHGWLDEPGKP